MAKITKVNTGGNNNSFAGCVLTGVCASAADEYVKQVTLTDGDALSDGMGMVVTFANGNTAGTAPDSLTIYSSDQINYYEDAQLTVPFTLAPQGCYTIEYTGTANAYTYISFPVLQVGSITAPISNNTGHIVSADLWAAGDAVHVIYSSGKFMLQLQPVSVVDVVQAQNMSPVTSNAVAGAVASTKQEIQAVESSLPTDAVLHYSFDDLPDYPDGTATLLRIKDFTNTDLSNWITVSGVTSSLQSGSLRLSTSVATRTSIMGCDTVNFTASSLNGKTIKLKVTSSFAIDRLGFQVQEGSYPINYLSKISQNGNTSIYCGVLPTGMTARSYLYANATSTLAEGEYVQVDEIYIGDGSYTTPVIDNANGQSNGESHREIAAQGVSGKGVYFPSANQYIGILTTKLPVPTSNNSFTISLWLNISSSYQAETVDCYKPIITVGSYAGLLGFFRDGYRSRIGFVARDSISGKIVTVDMSKGSFHHYVAVYDGTTHTFALFQDGVKVGTSAANPADYQFGTSHTAWRIWSNYICAGNASDVTNQPATLDDILIFNRALSQEEVQALYQNRANTPKYYNLNDYKLPAPPSTDGTFALKVTVSGGVASYSWV